VSDATNAPERPKRPDPSPRWIAPFLWFDWSMAWLVYFCSKVSFFKVLEYLGKLSIVAAIFLYVKEAPERKQRALADAWLLMNSGNGGQGIAGRYQALQYLAHEGVPLEGVRIWIANASGIDLHTANLQRAYIVSSVFNNSNLSSADLTEADLQNTLFAGANFSHAIFSDANLLCSDFRGARGLTVEQIKKGKNWEAGIYDQKFRVSLGLTGEDPKPRVRGGYECSAP
jgi:hypothetical protein